MPMKPFTGVLNAHGLSSHYTNYYYGYETTPSKIEVIQKILLNSKLAI